MITRVAGVTYSNEEYGVNRQDIIRNLEGDEKIIFRRDPTNRFDKNAVAVDVILHNGKRRQIGYLKAELAGIVADMWSEYRFIGKIAKINKGDEEEGIPWGISLELKKQRMKKEKNVNLSKMRNKGEKERKSKKSMGNRTP